MKPDGIRKQNEERHEHRARMEEKHGLAGHPKAKRLYELAWDYGHASGYSEIELYYEDLADLLK
jgi:hypothetical protein